MTSAVLAVQPRPSPQKWGEGGARVSGTLRRRRVFRRLMLFAILLSLTLAGCGKRNAPLPPPDEPNTFPRPYPSE
jgi:predicted small lipoprotein YifL